MSVRLSDVIEVLDEAYPPRLAQSWDSVGLVCGDPDDVLDSVTIAVDATPAVVDEVPEAGLLLAHHPLLLRGVDTVAASTPKGALVHRLIRTGRSLFTAHTNADSASPGVSDALPHALGLTVEAVLEPLRARRIWTSGSSTCRARTQKRCRPRCLRPAPATSATTRTAAGASAASGSSCRTRGRHPRWAASAPSSGWTKTGSRSSHPRERGPTCCRRCAPPIRTKSPRSTSSRWCPRPVTPDWAASATLPQPEPLRAFVSRVGAALPQTSWGVRAAGDPDAIVSRVAVCGGAGDSLLSDRGRADVQAYVTADLRHHPADEHRRASDVALIDVAHWASEFPWCAPGRRACCGPISGRRCRCGCPPSAPTRGILATQPGGDRVMKAEVAQQRSLLELSELDAELSRMAHQPPICRSAKRSSGCRPSTTPPMTGWARCESRWRTWTLRCRGSSRRSMRCASAKTGTGRCSVRGRPTPSNWRTCSTSWRPWNAVRAAWKIRCWRSWSGARSCRPSRPPSWSAIEALQAELASAQQALDAALAEIDEARQAHSSRRETLGRDTGPRPVGRSTSDSAPGEGRAPGTLQGHRCGSCRIEIDRGDLARITAAAEDEVVRCPECGAILLRVKGFGSVKVVIEADGGSRGNPGPAGYGAVVLTADRATVLAESKQAIGRATNNVAEYRGLIAGLDDAVKLGATEVEVFMDSKLVVEQMSGRWKVKHPDLIELHAQARGAGVAVRPDQLRVDSAGAQQACRSAGQRGDGRRGRDLDRDSDRTSEGVCRDPRKPRCR